MVARQIFTHPVLAIVRHGPQGRLQLMPGGNPVGLLGQPLGALQRRTTELEGRTRRHRRSCRLAIG